MKLKRNILLNPGPVTTTDTVKQALVVPDICHRETEFSRLIDQVRLDTKRVVHADDHYTSVLFGSSGTGAVEAAICSVIPEGTKLIVINNGVYGQRMVDIARRYNISVISLDSSPYGLPSLTHLEEMLQSDPQISTIAMVHHETSTGLLNPLIEAGKLAHQYSKTFIVDAISSYAGIPINIHQAHVDYLIATSNKCLQGMPGLSFVIANKQHLQAHGKKSKGYYFDLYSQYQSLENDHVLRFTPPVQIVYALKQALDEYFIEGEQGRYQRYSDNYNELVQGLKTLNFSFLVPEQHHSRLLVLIKMPPDKEHIRFNDLHDQLYLRGYTIYPTSVRVDHAFRLASFGAINKMDIQHFIQELHSVLDILKG